MRSKTVLMVAVLLAVTGQAFGQGIPVRIDAQDGWYALQIEDGQITGLYTIPVLTPDGPNPPQPPTPPTPNPDLSVTAQAVFDAVAEVETTGKQDTVANLAAILERLSDQTEDENQLKQSVPLTASFFLQSRGGARAWRPLTDEINALLAGCSGSECKKTVAEIVVGLNAASPDASASIDIEQIMAIIRLIMMILEMFQDQDAMGAANAVAELQQLLQQSAFKTIVPQTVPRQ